MSAAETPELGPYRGVCLVVMYFTIGGLERVVVDLANGLARRGLAVRVVVVETGKRNALLTELDGPVEIVCLHGSIPRRAAGLRRATRGWLVHFHAGDGKLRPIWRAALGRRPGLVLSYHSVYSHLRRRHQDVAERVVHRQFSAIVTVSEAVRAYCRDELGLDDRRLRTIENGIALGTIEPSPRAGPELRVLALASLYPHKNQRTVIRAVALARREAPIHLTVVGDGPDMAVLVEQSRRLGLHDAITWHGALWRRDSVQRILADSDVFVTASRFEGFSIALLEAMASGLPVVASGIAPHRRALGEAGRFVEPDDAEAMARVLVEWHRDDAARLAAGRAVRERARAFDVDACVDAHVALYRELASGTGLGAPDHSRSTLSPGGTQQRASKT